MNANELTFLKVIEAGSLKGAAEQLNTDPSSVSRKVAALEQHLGVKLIHRSTVRSQPTEAGLVYFQGLKHIAEQQAELENRLRGLQDRPSGTLTVAAPVDFGTQFVVPVLNKMRAAYADLKVELLLGSHFEDLTASGIDVAVRVGVLPDSGLICKGLGVAERVLVASPDYLEQIDGVTDPSGLSRCQFVFYSRAQANSQVSIKKGDTTSRVKVSGGFTVNSVSAVRQLVLAGKGVHLGPRWAFEEALNTGELVALLPDYQLEGFPIHALYRPGGYVPAKIRCFIEMISQHCKHSFDSRAGAR
ncbi:LysR family transcriptional regulator [Pseudoalteromonas sp. DL2-H2.2]|uniref:LysR family transcriptional regulator n=1 Tax=Pseudoalteromonas sp. DL2-H2.2 TaxID=2908889 RepID=UPI001F46C73F|nr:LysR family transcriptional regulator [Pseudoalteromonas sp. DL2-H2.2]MCF2907072.1 LysR family transcriptional regulator [Pseudoalteromonas sp. DL2-H2.2]